MTNLNLKGVRLAGKPVDSLWDVEVSGKIISNIQKHEGPLEVQAPGLVTPGLCHPHIHLDKCFLLSHPKYADLEIEKGDFAEAMELTSKAKARFEVDDLIERGKALIQESIAYGVTHMRAFVEVDATVGTKCLDAGLQLKQEFKDQCYVQICAFAQDPIFSQEDGGKQMTGMLEEAAARDGVEAVGSTPYVEKSDENAKKNIKWMIEITQRSKRHLDFHLDYNIDSKAEPLVHHVIDELVAAEWPNERVVTLGHCTRLTLFTEAGWKLLHSKIGKLPISFVGLPTSDLFMMGRPEDNDGGGERIRGTLQIPQMIQKYQLQGAIGVNNVGNAFTPQGSCDPLSVAALGVGIYQAGTKNDAQTLLECVSTRARAAIGLCHGDEELDSESPASLVVFGRRDAKQELSFRSRKSVQELIIDPPKDRMTIYKGRVVDLS